MKMNSGFIDDLRENWGIEEDSINEIIKAEPHAYYELTEENEYRRIFDIELEESSDKGYTYFQDNFSEEYKMCSYDEYKNWQMNSGEKFGKWLAKTWVTNQLKENYNLSIIPQFKNELFDMYMRKEYGELTALHTAGSKRKLMLTANPEDIVLCSSHGTFTSCMSLFSSYGQWRGIPSIIANPDIAMLAVLVPGDLRTEIKLKNGYVIKVPKIESRTWVYLTETDDKTLPFKLFCPRFFPQEFANAAKLRKTTGLHFIEAFKGKTPTRAHLPIYRRKGSSERYSTQPYFDSEMRITNYDISNNTYQIKPGESFARTTIIVDQIDFYRLRTGDPSGSYMES